MKKFYNLLLAGLANTKTEDEVKKILDDLLTPAERSDIEDRLAIVSALLSGSSQREVADKLGVSIAKVTRGAAAIRQSRGGFGLLVR